MSNCYFFNQLRYKKFIAYVGRWTMRWRIQLAGVILIH